MKRNIALLLIFFAIAVIAAGCSSKKEEWLLDKKHKPLPDYVLNSSDLIQETYIMAATYPEVVAAVPCYCGCYMGDGHENNLGCFIDSLGPGNAVEEWDSMSIS